MAQTILLIDPDPESAVSLAGRLKMQGFAVTTANDGVEGARAALASPPTILIADLWMPGVSGVQLCRLLKAEAATQDVPIVLRGPDGQRNRFWAERAGAVDYVTKGRIGDLVRALARAIVERAPADDFFTDLSGSIDIRDRIAANLDAALFESVLAAEVRALGACGEFERMFDLFSQFVSRLTSYRWLAVQTTLPNRVAIHSFPSMRARALEEARAALQLDEDVLHIPLEDEDAVCDPDGPPPIVFPIELGGVWLGKVALAVREPLHAQDPVLVSVLARELAAPLRVVSLVEESQRLATVDPLTGLMNRRAFCERLSVEIAQANRHGLSMSLLLLDIDHFKQINDTRGHATGDLVLAATGKILRKAARAGDLVARWGGEEFLVALPHTALEGASTCAERFRRAIEEMVVTDPTGPRVPATASIGGATFRQNEPLEALIDRADHAMYAAKVGGRNRVMMEEPTPLATERPASELASAVRLAVG